MQIMQTRHFHRALRWSTNREYERELWGTAMGPEERQGRGRVGYIVVL